MLEDSRLELETGSVMKKMIINQLTFLLKLSHKTIRITTTKIMQGLRSHNSVDQVDFRHSVDKKCVSAEIECEYIYIKMYY